jgi:hypothetical protein
METIEKNLCEIYNEFCKDYGYILPTGYLSMEGEYLGSYYNLIKEIKIYSLIRSVNLNMNIADPFTVKLINDIKNLIIEFYNDVIKTNTLILQKTELEAHSAMAMCNAEVLFKLNQVYIYHCERRRCFNNAFEPLNRRLDGDFSNKVDIMDEAQRLEIRKTKHNAKVDKQLAGTYMSNGSTYKHSCYDSMVQFKKRFNDFLDPKAISRLILGGAIKPEEYNQVKNEISSILNSDHIPYITKVKSVRNIIGKIPALKDNFHLIINFVNDIRKTKFSELTKEDREIIMIVFDKFIDFHNTLNLKNILTHNYSIYFGLESVVPGLFNETKDWFCVCEKTLEQDIYKEKRAKFKQIAEEVIRDIKGGIMNRMGFNSSNRF